MEDIIFQNTEIFWLLFAIPLFFGIFIFLRFKRKQQLQKLGNIKVVSVLVQGTSIFRPWFKFSLIMLSVSLLIVALARPQFATETKVKANENNEIIIALDISNSMLAKAQNSTLTRLDYAQKAINDLIANLENEKIGMVVFAGQAIMQVPITHDYSAFKLILNSIDPSYISAQGTDLTDAINLSVNAFSPIENNQKTIIIISDGEDHEGNIEPAIEKAKQNGIKIYTVGIGSTRGEPIYLNGSILKDQNGEVVMSKLNEDILRQIANQTGGDFINFTSNSQALKDVYYAINQTDASGKTKVAKFDDKYHYFVFPALLLLIFDFFILIRKNKWISKIDIFNKNFT
ncbi:MAG: VWA domain-containing protein [Bacteroidales bacterium]|nr:VWA domain-containing protein [Bacteroidales bacterium]